MNATLSKLTVEPCKADWPHNDLKADFTADRNVWRAVSEEFYNEMLGVLPPIDFDGHNFLVGEPYTDKAGDTIYCGLVHINEQYFARYVPRKQFKKLILELRALGIPES